ncbi:MAG: hypothetical protein R3F54_20995 [Alphaproteobacteria bacterium]
MLQRRHEGADREENEQNDVPKAAFFFGDRLAGAAMGALAAFGGNRHLAQAAAGQFLVGTRHQDILEIAELLIAAARAGRRQRIALCHGKRNTKRR